MNNYHIKQTNKGFIIENNWGQINKILFEDDKPSWKKKGQLKTGKQRAEEYKQMLKQLFGGRDEVL